MSAYDELIEAATRYLKGLKAQGTRHITLDPESWAALAQPPPRKPAQPAKPGRDRADLNPAGAGSRSRPQTPAGPPASARTDTPPQSAPPTPPATPPPATPTPPSSPVPPPEIARPLAVSASRLPRAEKEAAFAELRGRALMCQKCPHLVRSRTNVVFGVGEIDAEVMFVGEAPGAEEDLQGEPFVGRAGQLLTRIIQAMGFSRETVYIANVLKCRPDTPGQASGNRKPEPAEMETCLPYLLAQIELIQPRVLVALGATAMHGLFGKPCQITRQRGQFIEFRGIPVMPTFHPSYLLRNQSLQVKRQVWEDMLQVLEKLGEPISEKQRNFFLKRA